MAMSSPALTQDELKKMVGYKVCLDYDSNW